MLQLHFVQGQGAPLCAVPHAIPLPVPEGPMLPSKPLCACVGKGSECYRVREKPLCWGWGNGWVVPGYRKCRLSGWDGGRWVPSGVGGTNGWGSSWRRRLADALTPSCLGLPRRRAADVPCAVAPQGGVREPCVGEADGVDGRATRVCRPGQQAGCEP